MDLMVNLGLAFGCFFGVSSCLVSACESGILGGADCSICVSGNGSDCLSLRSDSSSSIFLLMSESVDGELATDTTNREDCCFAFHTHAHR